MTNAERQRRYRERRAAGRPPRPKPRPARWAAALAELRILQAEYEAWRDQLPESLADSRTAELLEGVYDVDLDALDVELPRGFGTRLNGGQDRVAVMRVWNEARGGVAGTRRRGGGTSATWTRLRREAEEEERRRIDAGKRVMGWPERAGADPRTQPWPGSKPHGHAGAGVGGSSR